MPPEMMSAIEVPAEIAQIERVNEFIHNELEQRSCPLKTQHQLDIAVEEMFVNVCHYAYTGEAASNDPIVRIQQTYSEEPSSVTIDLIDSGIPFDPLAKPDVQQPTDIESVPIGGLGIFMTKKVTDEVRYKRENGKNIVTLVKKW